MAEPRPPVVETRKRASAAQPARWRLPDWWTNANHKWLKTAAVAGGLILLLVLGTFAYALATLPDPSKLDIGAGLVRLIDRNGALIEERNAEGARVSPVKLPQISATLRNATIAVEDKNFYQHHGIDWGRVIKAGIVDTIARRPEQGASTITEQLAKITVLRSPKRSILIKLREAMVATSLESRYTKDEILQIYLNTIFYGHHATGIEAAAQVYFGKHASDLSLAEASMLAGLPNGPSYYDPALHLERAQARQAIVLDAMVRQHMISSDQATEAADTKLNFVFKENRSSQAPHFVDFVFEQLENLYMVGSADFFNNNIQGQFNVVTGLRQPGSSFKPYVYEQAFKSRKLTMGNLLDDTSRHFAGGQFHDFDMRDMGIITAHKALVQSRNIPALETMQMTGIDDVNNLARDMGITTNLKSEVTTAIGSSEVRMLDHVVGYGVFATGGVRHDPVSILSITDRSGNTLDTPSPPKAKQVLTPQETYLITYILKDYSSTWGLGWNRPFAGKSGTTNNYRDAWMMAYAPNLVVGAWVGHTGPGNSDMNGVYGSMVGSSTLRDFINNGLATAHFSVETFQRPSGLVDGRPCADNSNVSSSPSTSASPSGSAKNVGSEKEIFLPGTECKPAPTPSPSPTPSPLPSLVPSVLPSLLGTPTPSPSPSGTAAPSGVP
ncbi:MAG: hypothetical protein E6I31_13595 [Chloroflexi bacterium]|nr:MAG: hypothetical protein E6I31_13595 [Chloroflexota bacterium]